MRRRGDARLATEPSKAAAASSDPATTRRAHETLPRAFVASERLLRNAATTAGGSSLAHGSSLVRTRGPRDSMSAATQRPLDSTEGSRPVPSRGTSAVMGRHVRYGASRGVRCRRTRQRRSLKTGSPRRLQGGSVLRRRLIGESPTPPASSLGRASTYQVPEAAETLAARHAPKDGPPSSAAGRPRRPTPYYSPSPRPSTRPGPGTGGRVSHRPMPPRRPQDGKITAAAMLSHACTS